MTSVTTTSLDATGVLWEEVFRGPKCTRVRAGDARGWRRRVRRTHVTRTRASLNCNVVFSSDESNSPHARACSRGASVLPRRIARTLPRAPVASRHRPRASTTRAAASTTRLSRPSKGEASLRFRALAGAPLCDALSLSGAKLRQRPERSEVFTARTSRHDCRRGSAPSTADASGCCSPRPQRARSPTSNGCELQRFGCFRARAHARRGARRSRPVSSRCYARGAAAMSRPVDLDARRARRTRPPTRAELQRRAADLAREDAARLASTVPDNDGDQEHTIDLFNGRALW